MRSPQHLYCGRSFLWQQPQLLSQWILVILTFSQMHESISLRSGRLYSSFARGTTRATGTHFDNTLSSALFSTTDNSGVRINGFKPKKDDEIKIAQRHARFAGVGRLYSQGSASVSGQAVDDSSLDPHLALVDRLAESTVVVIGIGGVGSWAAEALCRSGVGNLILIDLDDICISNTNRQLHATSSTIGKRKIDEMKRRLLDINPDCNVTNIHDFVLVENVNDLLDQMQPELDVCLDCLDGAKEKTALLVACTERKLPVVTCGGAAGKLDPTKIVADDLARVSEDRMLALVRKNLRQEHGFGKGLPFENTKKKKVKMPRKWRITAVFSTEVPNPLPTTTEAIDASTLRRCDGALGTACFVTGTFGFVAASQVVSMLAKGKLSRPRKDDYRVRD